MTAIGRGELGSMEEYGELYTGLLHSGWDTGTTHYRYHCCKNYLKSCLLGIK